ncbi:hypothetical protein SAMN06265360_105174 [Haloechinothrix alba]|uniref:Pirin n=1 Tax=Haloechinothrix alba TaxID=664784 RepID=A0A238W6P9_9PSEU|nr:pirin family protein [Haloechinothrix alba]SNR42226.1 hypothetical protein SAMN06265360_105174 [Haloechinothrix alba]
MSNTETDPVELACRTRVASPARVEVLGARSVPLGGQRAMRVRRTLPQRARSMVGPWCFADQFGPDEIAETGGVDVPPHPHTGLQTVTWLFAGEIEHRDSSGVRALVRPGELNLMTGGRGICHSEVATRGGPVLHGVQLWVALPDEHRDAPRDFQHHVPEPVELDGATVRVFLGELAGVSSPARAFSPLLGAELLLAPSAELTLDVDAAFEHGVLACTGAVTVEGTELDAGDLACLGTGTRSVTVTNRTTEPARAILLGGEPFGTEIVMWWNFVGRSHEEIVRFAEEWEQESERFGRVEGYSGSTPRLPVPPLPGTRLKPRGNPG